MSHDRGEFEKELCILQPVLLRIVKGDWDALQAVNERLLRGRHRIRDLPRYAKRVACHEQRRACQPTRYAPLDAAERIADTRFTPLESACRREEFGLLRDAIERLPPRQRDVMQAQLVRDSKAGRQGADNSAQYNARKNLRRLLG